MHAGKFIIYCDRSYVGCLFNLIIAAGATNKFVFKDIYFCPIEIIKGLTDKGQFQYLTKLKGPQEGI